MSECVCVCAHTPPFKRRSPGREAVSSPDYTLGMSDTSMDQQPQRRQRRRQRPGARPYAPTTGLRALVCFTLLGLCAAGHRPYQKGERGPRPPGLPDRRPAFQADEQEGAQRVDFPSLSDMGYQRVQLPWMQDRGQVVQYPAFEDSADDAQTQVKGGRRRRRRGRVRGGAWGASTLTGRGRAFVCVCVTLGFCARTKDADLEGL